jgi:hypothetical protein
MRHGEGEAGGSSGGSDDDFWDGLYCHLITCFGWTWEYVDQSMTFPRLAALNVYWKRNPPLHQLVANYLGYNGKAEKTEQVDDLIALIETGAV